MHHVRALASKAAELAGYSTTPPKKRANNFREQHWHAEKELRRDPNILKRHGLNGGINPFVLNSYENNHSHLPYHADVRRAIRIAKLVSDSQHESAIAPYVRREQELRNRALRGIKARNAQRQPRGPRNQQATAQRRQQYLESRKPVQKTVVAPRKNTEALATRTQKKLDNARARRQSLLNKKKEPARAWNAKMLDTAHDTTHIRTKLDDARASYHAEDVLHRYRLPEYSEKTVRHVLKLSEVPEKHHDAVTRMLVDPETRRALRTKIGGKRMASEQRRNDTRHNTNVAIKMKYADQRGKNASSVLSTLPDIGHMIRAARKFKELKFDKNLRTDEQAAMSKKIKNWASQRSKTHVPEPLAPFPWGKQKYANAVQRKRNINARTHQKRVNAVAIKNQKIQEARAAREAMHAQQSDALSEKSWYQASDTLQRKRNINARTHQKRVNAVAIKNQKIQEARATKEAMHGQQRIELLAQRKSLKNRIRGMGLLRKRASSENSKIPIEHHSYVPKRASSVTSRNSPLDRQNSVSTVNNHDNEKKNAFKGLAGLWGSALHSAKSNK